MCSLICTDVAGVILCESLSTLVALFWFYLQCLVSYAQMLLVLFCVKVLAHWLLCYGLFSPVCSLICLIRLHVLEIVFFSTEIPYYLYNAKCKMTSNSWSYILPLEDFSYIFFIHCFLYITYHLNFSININ